MCALEANRTGEVGELTEIEESPVGARRESVIYNNSLLEAGLLTEAG